MNPWQQGLAYLDAALTLAVLWRLWSAGIAAIYKLLFFYLAVDFLLTTAALRIQANTDWYAYSYISGQTAKILVAALVLVEIYSRSLENTPALAQFVRNSVAYVLAAAAIFPVVLLLLDRSPARYPLLRGFFLFEQTMGATMGIFLVLLSLFLAYFPVRLRRNVFFYSSGFIAWALTHSAAVFLVNHAPGNQRFRATVNLFQATIQASCLLYWLLGMRQEGETRTAVVGHLWSREEAERLTGQLAAINTSLERMRAPKKI